jgi:molybdopterin synthase catalytic subunit
MVVKVLLFAILRERAGAGSVEIDLDDGATVQDALAELRKEPGLADVLERMPVRMAVNRDYAEPGRRLAGGDELALVPPVSGGAPGAPEPDRDLHAGVTESPLDQTAITARVSRPGAGAVVTFQGTTRDVSRLEYEAYAEMARERIASILRDVRAEHGLEAVACEHRVGVVPLGEPSVVVAASAAHRAEAFAGARAAIDRIKAEAPIWKKEVDEGPGGETASAIWVEGSLPGVDPR